jgi:hypothetical protein
MYLLYLMFAAMAVMVLSVFFFTAKTAINLRKVKDLSNMFWLTSFSFVSLVASTALLFMVGGFGYLTLAAVTGIMFSGSLSSAIIKMTHPNADRPKNWLMLAYAVMPILLALGVDLEAVYLNTLIIGAVINAAAFALLIAHCNREFTPYAAAGTISAIPGIASIFFIFVQFYPISSVTNFGFVAQLTLTGLFAFAFYGMYRISRKGTKHFVCGTKERSHK